MSDSTSLLRREAAAQMRSDVPYGASGLADVTLLAAADFLDAVDHLWGSAADGELMLNLTAFKRANALARTYLSERK